jgi:hypothetical protein
LLDAFDHLLDNPIPPLRDIAGYLTATYGPGTTRRDGAGGESNALRAIIETDGDIDRSRWGAQPGPSGGSAARV